MKDHAAGLRDGLIDIARLKEKPSDFDGIDAGVVSNEHQAKVTRCRFVMSHSVPRGDDDTAMSTDRHSFTNSGIERLRCQIRFWRSRPVARGRCWESCRSRRRLRWNPKQPLF